MDLANTFSPLVNFRSSQSQTLSSGFFSGIFGGAVSKNGTIVNSKSALTLSAYYNAIDIITNDIAKLPKAVYKKDGENRDVVGTHPAHRLISVRPNQYMSSYMYHKMLILDAIQRGNGYAEIERNTYTSSPEAFQFINQDKTPVTVKKYGGKLWYEFGGRIVSGENIIHIPGFSFNGITGIGVIAFAAQSLGVGLSSQEFASDYYKQKGMGKGVATAAQPMKPDAKIRYAKAMSEALSSNNSKFNVAVADGINSFTHLRITPQEAEFLETNKAAIGEVARWLNISLHKLKLLDNVNNSITENLEIGHIADSILPWSTKLEQEYDEKIFSEKEKQTNFYVKVKEGALLRSDKKTQAEFFSKLIYAGVYTRNEVRQLLDMNSLDGLDEPLTPVNTQLMEQIELQLKLLKKSSNE